MSILIAGLLIFLATHSTRIVAPAWREAMIARMGKHAWRALVSVLSLIGFVLLIKGYDTARMNPINLYEPPVWLRPVTLLLMFFAAVFAVAAIVPRNHTKAAMGHPLVLSVKTWAFAHLLSNGTLADVILFGGFLLWAVPDFIRSRRSDRAQGVVYPEGGLGNTLVTVIVGAILWAVFAFYLHAHWVGVAPIPL